MDKTLRVAGLNCSHRSGVKAAKAAKAAEAIHFSKTFGKYESFAKPDILKMQEIILSFCSHNIPHTAASH